jgi:hypothetical protein
MSSPPRLRRPVSTRHAFALAFDLSVRRDALQSLIVPLVLRAPWIIAQAVLPPLDETDRPGHVLMLRSVALLGDFLVLVVVGAMLRVRARSVFNTPLTTRPAPALECYATGLRRVPWLMLTEIVRNAAIGVATLFLIVPGLFLGYQLAFATEDVVLNRANLTNAFRHSFRLARDRFERWLEMVVVSVLLALSAAFLVASASLVWRDVSLGIWVAVFSLATVAITPVIQYAWTFFYLRLVEVEDAHDRQSEAMPAPPPSPTGGAPMLES